MKDRFNWVYLLLMMVCFGLCVWCLFTRQWTPALITGWATNACVFHIKLNEILWRVSHGKRK